MKRLSSYFFVLLLVAGFGKGFTQPHSQPEADAAATEPDAGARRERPAGGGLGDAGLGVRAEAGRVDEHHQVELEPLRARGDSAVRQRSWFTGNQ